MIQPNRNLNIRHFRIQRREEAYPLAQLLAAPLPNPDIYVTAIYELLLNAVEHGNLGIHYNEKNELIRAGEYDNEIDRRHALPDNQNKYVLVTLSQKGDYYRLSILDQGKGFNWRDYVARAVENEQFHGRGLRMALNAKFDRILFNTSGNQVTCLLRHRLEFTPQERQLISQNILGGGI